MNEPILRDVSDTARWVAWYRAHESARRDALFNDPYAARLAGDRGQRIAAAMQTRGRNEWVFIARTLLFDRIVSDAVNAGADTILNLASGLDARPYRMNLPPSLRWFEVDLPHMVDYMETQLADATPKCQLRRIRLDLENEDERRKLFADVAAGSNFTLVITEGLLPYFSPPAVQRLATDLAAQRPFKQWVTDLMSPRVVQMLGQQYNKHLTAAPFKFAPENGVDFFVPLGWRAKEVVSMMKKAAEVKRLPLLLRLFARIPINVHKPGRQPWSATVLLERA